MARFNMVVSHGLPEDEALRRVREEIENLKRQYSDKDKQSSGQLEQRDVRIRRDGDGICSVGYDDGEAIPRRGRGEAALAGAALQGQN